MFFYLIKIILGKISYKIINFKNLQRRNILFLPSNQNKFVYYFH